ncbi:MAG: hypothetical protein JJE04_16315 [Acidobacteriia bacterium]|nr:hypothetical protein [Terriglobia bacterium]
MEHTVDELEAIVRNRICSVCTERTTDDQCGLEDPSSCALFRLFPQVAQAIQSVNSSDIQPYIDAIRRNVCSVCQEQAQDASCEARQQVQCALDAYLLLVVDAIEEATGKTFDKTGIQNLPAGPAVVPGPQLRL